LAWLQLYPSGHNGIQVPGPKLDLLADLFYTSNANKKDSSLNVVSSNGQSVIYAVKIFPDKITSTIKPVPGNGCVTAKIPAFKIVPSRDLLLSLVDWPGAGKCTARLKVTVEGMDLEVLVRQEAIRRKKIKEKKVARSSAAGRSKEFRNVTEQNLLGGPQSTKQIEWRNRFLLRGLEAGDVFGPFLYQISWGIRSLLQEHFLYQRQKHSTKKKNRLLTNCVLISCIK
jgi:hypothetical protein